jgi:hypothetical protein
LTVELVGSICGRTQTKRERPYEQSLAIHGIPQVSLISPDGV